MSDVKSNKSYTSRKSRVLHRGARFVFFAVFIFVVAGVSSVIVDKYLFPYLTSVDWLNKYNLFKKGAENIVVINKTEEVVISEEQTIAKYSDKAASSVVEIVSRKKSGKKVKSLDKNKSEIGSGLIITADGLVITHREAIIDKSAEYRIFTYDNKSYIGKLLMIDSFSNLAFLKLEGATNLPTASFINPDDIKIGAKVVVIGKSGSNSQTFFKSGLISQFAKNYSISGPLASSEKLQGVFFLDADFENDWDESLIGSAVVDYNGDVIGILGAVKDDQRMRFFVAPVNHIQELTKRYLEEGVVERSTLGIYYVPLTKETAYLSGSGLDRGALVYSSSLQQGLAVIAGSPADKAGLRIMDIIISVNGEEINSDQNLAYLISKYKPGDEITLKIVRDGERIDVKAILE